MKIITSVIVLLTLITACGASPVEQTERKYEKGAQVLNPSGSANNSSTSSIKQRREQKYLLLLQELKQKNANHDAQRAINNGNFHVLGYYAGRGVLTIPNIEQSQNRCTVKQVDGMGDTIYGKTHFEYRFAVKEYVSQFNLAMLQYCK